MSVVRAYIHPDFPDRIAVESGYEHKDRIQSMLARKWSAKALFWHLPLAWSSCLQLRSEFGDDLVIDPTLGAWAAGHKRDVIEPALALREEIKLDDVQLNHVGKQAKIIGDELGLFPHQPTGAAFMATTGSCGIFDETGTGKSAQTIAAMRSLHRAGDSHVFPALIVVPNSVKMTWKREFQRWWPGLVVHLIDGSPAQRRKIFETPGHVYISNYEQMHHHSRLARFGNMELKRCIECGGLDERITVKKCEVHEREFNQIDFQTVVCDEIHRMLHPSKQTRAIWSVSDKAVHRYGLTGTPIQDKIDDYWFILRYLAPEEFPAKTRYIDRYADVGYTQWGMMEILGLKKDKEAEFRAVTNLMMRRMLKDIVLPFLPPIIRERRYVRMTPPQAKAYKQMLKDAMAELNTTDIEVIAASSPLSKATRLLQFSSSYGVLVDTDGHIIGSAESKNAEPIRLKARQTAHIDNWPKVKAQYITDHPSADDASIDRYMKSYDALYDALTGEDEPIFKLASPSNKINAFMDDLDSGDFGESSIVVFAQSRQLIDMLSAEMTKKKIPHGMITGGQSTEERQKSIDDFQAKKIKYILVTIQAGGVGLTLTAADVNVFLQRSYSSTAMKQAISRSHRIGAEIHDRILIVDYVSEDTIEEKQLEALEAKDGRIEEILKDKDLLRKFLDPTS